MPYFVCSIENMKPQNPMLKIQQTSKIQCSKTWGLGNWGFLGPWSLVIGVLRKTIMSSKAYTLLLAILFVALPTGVFAQEFFGAFGGNVSLTVTPEFPRANEKVTIEARGFSLDLNRAEVSWAVNGTLMKKAVGGNTFSFETGPLGSASSVVVSVRGLSGQMFRSARCRRILG